MAGRPQSFWLRDIRPHSNPSDKSVERRKPTDWERISDTEKVAHGDSGAGARAGEAASHDAWARTGLGRVGPERQSGGALTPHRRAAAAGAPVSMRKRAPT
jgi:hypothetical protein